MRGKSLLRAALDPGLLVRAMLGSLAWPFRRLKHALRGGRPPGLRWAEDGPPAGATERRADVAGSGPYVLFTGLGFGEFVMIERVANALRAQRPDVRIGVALRHRRAVEHVRDRLPDLDVSWWPPDGLHAVLRLLDARRPDVVTLIEGYRQPFLVVGAARYGARIALLNGRLRDRSSFHNPFLTPGVRWLFRAYAAMAMREPESVAVVRPFVRASCDLLASGDLKLDFVPPVLDRDQLRGLERWLASDLPLVAAGSTDSVEEEAMVLAAFARTHATVPCRLLLAPRHPEGIDDLIALLKRTGLAFSRRSEKETPNADVLLLDTQGELATAYRPCVAAYVGGSYGARSNGHNPIEPLAWGVPVAYGVRRGHFESIQRLVEEAGAATRVEGEADLAAFWLRFLRDSDERERIGASGRNLVERSRGAVARTAEMLARLLDDPEL